MDFLGLVKVSARLWHLELYNFITYLISKAIEKWIRTTVLWTYAGALQYKVYMAITMRKIKNQGPFRDHRGTIMETRSY